MGKGTKKTLVQGLHFEKKNKDLLRLPKYARIQKRPIPHPPAASPYAGASAPKIVYVSTNTPIMSAIKRTQKLLQQAEKRAMKSSAVLGRRNESKMTEKERFARLAQSQEALEKEKVFIKATGRAIETALRVGRWFEQKGDEYAVQIKTGSVIAVDDILEDEEAKEKERQREKVKTEEDHQKSTREHLDIKQRTPNSEQPHVSATTDVGVSGANEISESQDPAPVGSKLVSSQRKKKRRKKHQIPTEIQLPESRTRWVKMVDIAINLK